jgi:hypothetical protein
LTYDGYSLVNSGPTGPTGRGIINADYDPVLDSAIGALYPNYIINSSESDFVGIASKYVDDVNNNTPSIIFGDNPDGTNDLSFSFLNYVPGPPASYTSSELLKLTWDGKLYLNNTPTRTNTPTQYLTRNSSTGVIEYSNLNQNVPSLINIVTNYTPSLDDVGKTIFMNAFATNIVTIPPSSSVNFPQGTSIQIIRGQSVWTTSITGGNGVTIWSRNNWRTISAQYGLVSLMKVNSTDTWFLWGDLS